MYRNAHYPPHSHRGLTTHLIRRGTLTITYPEEGATPSKETFGVGARIDVPAGKVHEVWMGAEGESGTLHTLLSACGVFPHLRGSHADWNQRCCQVVNMSLGNEAFSGANRLYVRDDDGSFVKLYNSSFCYHEGN